jgi:hypothetical protein
MLVCLAFGQERHVVRTADKESEIFYLFGSAESSKNALTSGIPVYNIFTHKYSISENFDSYVTLPHHQS